MKADLLRVLSPISLVCTFALSLFAVTLFATMQAAEAVLDSTTCINNLEKIVAGFNMADQLPVSDNHATVVRADILLLSALVSLSFHAFSGHGMETPSRCPKRECSGMGINASIYLSRTQIPMARQPRSSS